MRYYCSPPQWGSAKHTEKRAIKLPNLNEQNLSPAIEEQLQELRLVVKQQGDKVRHLKASDVPGDNIKLEIQELKRCKKELEDKILELAPVETFDKAKMDDVIKQNFLFDKSFSLYGDVAGQYDFGPAGCQILDNIISEWEKFFIFNDQMMKVNCSVLTPSHVLEASGHIERFADIMVKDLVTGHLYRLDHLIKDCLQSRLKKGDDSQDLTEIQRKLQILDSMTVKEMTDILREYEITSPSGNELGHPVAMNLMFPITLDPSGNAKEFLRPETSQGIFMNFRQLLKRNHKKLPFACAQIGRAFRNEINPQKGLLRVREFTMGEIIHFCYPDEKTHPKFPLVSNTELWLHSVSDQIDGEPAKRLTIGEAVQTKLVSSEIMGYYMARIQQFLLNIGIDRDKLRFRQHLSTEMAHYACECWDAECLTSYGWVECVGCADRGTYDLEHHSKAIGSKLVAQRKSQEPKMMDVLSLYADKSSLKKHFKDSSKDVYDTLRKLSQGDLEKMDQSLQSSGKYVLEGGFTITEDMKCQIKKEEKLVDYEDVTPNVIEPSFGFGRIFYSLLEHTFRVRDTNAARTFFTLPSRVAPVKVSVFPVVSNNPELHSIAEKVFDSLMAVGIPCNIDHNSSIGRRYAHSDTIGIPLAITIDSKSPDSATLRERDSTRQVRIPIDVIPDVVLDLTKGNISWNDVESSWSISAEEKTS